MPRSKDETELLKEQIRDLLGKRYKPERVTVRWRPRSGCFRKHFVIPDTQVKAGVPTDHLTWAGKYIAEHATRGDVVVHLGDHWDMPSLSSYDRGKKCFEGRRFKSDVEAGNEAMALLNEPLEGLELERHFLFGNHEDRITRTVELDPWLEGIVGLELLDLRGWHTHQYQKIVRIDGILYSHYFYNPRNGRPWTGVAGGVLNNVGSSFVQGHRQGLDVALRQLPAGGRRRGVICGSFYQHDEEYLGPQGDHWRGMLMLTEVQEGDFDLVEVSLDYLKRKYG